MTWISEQYLIHYEVLVFICFVVCTYEYTIQVQLSKTADLSRALTAIVTILNMVEVERIEDIMLHSTAAPSLAIMSVCWSRHW